MSSIVATILGLLGQIISKVFTNLLSTPAKETNIETPNGPLDVPITSDNDLLNQYNWMHSRG